MASVFNQYAGGAKKPSTPASPSTPGSSSPSGTPSTNPTAPTSPTGGSSSQKAAYPIASQIDGGVRYSDGTVRYPNSTPANGVASSNNGVIAGPQSIPSTPANTSSPATFNRGTSTPIRGGGSGSYSSQPNYSTQNNQPNASTQGPSSSQPTGRVTTSSGYFSQQDTQATQQYKNYTPQPTYSTQPGYINNQTNKNNNNYSSPNANPLQNPALGYGDTSFYSDYISSVQSGSSGAPYGGLGDSLALGELAQRGAYQEGQAAYSQDRLDKFSQAVIAEQQREFTRTSYKQKVIDPYAETFASYVTFGFGKTPEQRNSIGSGAQIAVETAGEFFASAPIDVIGAVDKSILVGKSLFVPEARSSTFSEVSRARKDVVTPYTRTITGRDPTTGNFTERSIIGGLLIYALPAIDAYGSTKGKSSDAVGSISRDVSSRSSSFDVSDNPLVRASNDYKDSVALKELQSDIERNAKMNAERPVPNSIIITEGGIVDGIPQRVKYAGADEFTGKPVVKSAKVGTGGYFSGKQVIFREGQAPIIFDTENPARTPLIDLNAAERIAQVTQQQKTSDLFSFLDKKGSLRPRGGYDAETGQSLLEQKKPTVRDEFTTENFKRRSVFEEEGISESTKPRTRYGSLYDVQRTPRTSTFTDTLQRTEPRSVQDNIQVQKPRQAPEQRLSQGPKTEQKSIFAQDTRTKSKLTFAYDVPKEGPIARSDNKRGSDSPFGVPFGFTQGGGGGYSSKRSPVKGKPSLKYSPSLVGIAFGIKQGKGKRSPNQNILAVRGI